ncbi:MAG: ADP-ribosylglycohydrolase family protein [Thermodesulfobacteriota bacterium]
MDRRKRNQQNISGCILGTAVGDALGLPYEGLSRRRGRKLFPDPGRHHLLLGRGMVSDDTEHTCFVALALIASKGEPKKFQNNLARSLRWWLLGLPAGVGFATLRAILKLWLGASPAKSGVFSAGNGPAMRSPILGLVFGRDPEKLREMVKISTRITHTDPKAFYGAYAAALAAHYSASETTIPPDIFYSKVQEALKDEAADEFVDLLQQAVESAKRGESTAHFSASIGGATGISGYIYHTVPSVIQTWLRHQNNFGGAIEEMILAGGDSDTTAAILGGISGARGIQHIPAAWINGIIDWPRSTQWMAKVGDALFQTMENRREMQPPGYFLPGLLLRNIFFLIVVLLHGLRRLAPPY